MEFLGDYPASNQRGNNTKALADEAIAWLCSKQPVKLLSRSPGSINTSCLCQRKLFKLKEVTEKPRNGVKKGVEGTTRRIRGRWRGRRRGRRRGIHRRRRPPPSRHRSRSTEGERVLRQAENFDDGLYDYLSAEDQRRVIKLLQGIDHSMDELKSQISPVLLYNVTLTTASQIKGKPVCRSGPKPREPEERSSGVKSINLVKVKEVKEVKEAGGRGEHEWSEWGGWSCCSVTCGPGLTTRTRSRRLDSLSLAVEQTDTMPCLMPPCPAPGVLPFIKRIFRL